MFLNGPDSTYWTQSIAWHEIGICFRTCTCRFYFLILWEHSFRYINSILTTNNWYEYLLKLLQACTCFCVSPVVYKHYIQLATTLSQVSSGWEMQAGFTDDMITWYCWLDERTATEGVKIDPKTTGHWSRVLLSICPPTGELRVRGSLVCGKVVERL